MEDMLGDGTVGRRMFLTGWCPNHLRTEGTVSVSILVAYSASNSWRDDIRDVVNYNVMRDTLIALRPVLNNQDCARIAETLVTIPGVLFAEVTMQNLAKHILYRCIVKSLAG